MSETLEKALGILRDNADTKTMILDLSLYNNYQFFKDNKISISKARYFKDEDLIDFSGKSIVVDFSTFFRCQNLEDAIESFKLIRSFPGSLLITIPYFLYDDKFNYTYLPGFKEKQHRSQFNPDTIENIFLKGLDNYSIEYVLEKGCPACVVFIPTDENETEKDIATE